MKSVFNKKPQIQSDSSLIFRKHGIIGMSGMMLILLFSLVLIFGDYYVTEVIKSYSFPDEQIPLVNAMRYILPSLFILLGLRLLLSFMFDRVILTNSEVIKMNSLTKFKKSINMKDLISIKYSNRHGGNIVLKSVHSVIKFSIFFGGLSEILDFLKKHLPEDKTKQINKDISNILTYIQDN